MSENPEAFGET